MDRTDDDEKFIEEKQRDHQTEVLMVMAMKKKSILIMRKKKSHQLKVQMMMEIKVVQMMRNCQTIMRHHL